MSPEELQIMNTNKSSTMNTDSFLKVYHPSDKTYNEPLYIKMYGEGIIVSTHNDLSIKYQIKYLDLIGAEVPLEDDNEGQSFNIFSTKFEDVGWFFSKIDYTKRVPDIIEFKIKKKDYEYSELVNFKHYIMNTFWRWMQKEHNSGFDLEKEKDSYTHPKGLQPYEAKIMVFVSPASGKGYAPARWKVGERFLRARGYIPIVHHTPRRRYIMDTIRELSVEEFKEIFLFIGVGGDGLMHEILNGFKTRPDVQDCVSNQKMRCASMMGGSACSVVSFMAMRWKLNKFSLYNNLYIITRCRLFNSKTMEIETNGKQKKIYSFHTLSSGYIADVVKNSEFQRFLGELRYLIMLIVGIFTNKNTATQFYITEHDVELPPLEQPLPIENVLPGQKKQWITYQGSIYLVMAMIFEFLTNDFKLSDRCKLDGELGECFYLKGALGRRGLQKFQSGFIKHNQFEKGFDSFQMWKSLRVINTDPKLGIDTTCFQVDGEIYYCSSFQATQHMDNQFNLVL